MTVASVVAQALHNWKALSWAVLGLFVVPYVGNAIRVWYRLKHIKGPFSAAFSKFWLVRSHVKQTAYLDVADVCEKYGELEAIFLSQF
jgi:hypothetical protein